MRTRNFKINDASSFVKRTMVRDFIATALPTKAVCWTLVAANIFSVSFLRKIVRSLVFLYLLFLLLGERMEKLEKSILFSLFSRAATIQFNSLNQPSEGKKSQRQQNTFPREQSERDNTKRERESTTERERERGTKGRETERQREGVREGVRKNQRMLTPPRVAFGQIAEL